MEASRSTESTTAGPSAGADDGVFGLETIALDLPAVVGAFSQRLHDGGLSVTPAQSGHYMRALQLTQPGSRQQLYFTSRAIFVTDVQHVAVFDRVFADVFGSHGESDDFELEPVLAAARS